VSLPPVLRHKKRNHFIDANKMVPAPALPGC
jgi:hypothetical protein